jgi:DNA mismatch repair protein MutS
VAVREAGEQIVFLHRLQPGAADRSYGIEVGRLAGLPGAVIDRARQVLALLEGEHLAEGLAAPGERRGPASRAEPVPAQLGLFAAGPHPLVERIAAIDVNTMTPVQAITALASLVEEARRPS